MKSEPKPSDRLLTGLRYGGSGKGHLVHIRREPEVGGTLRLRSSGGLFQVVCDVDEADAAQLGVHFPGIFFKSAEVKPDALRAYSESLPVSRRIFALDVSVSTTQRSVGLFKDGELLCTLMNEAPRHPTTPMPMRDGKIVWDLYDPQELCKRWGDAAVARFESGAGFGATRDEQESVAVELYRQAIVGLAPVVGDDEPEVASPRP